MRQPKYQFGDTFTKEVLTEVCGNSVRVEIYGVVARITASTNGAYLEYRYDLWSGTPEHYAQIKLVQQEITEKDLDKGWTHVPF